MWWWLVLVVWGELELGSRLMNCSGVVLDAPNYQLLAAGRG